MDHGPSTNKTILLTGGTGLIGAKLAGALLQKGHRVNLLSRRPVTVAGAAVFHWDVAKGEIDAQCIEEVDTIIHLAGEGVADKRWTAARKKAIIESRTESIHLVYQLLKTNKHTVKSVVSASAVGYYGDRDDEELRENSAAGTDFLANCCVQWEAAVDEGKGLGLRVTKFRTGVVLDNGGALAKMAAPVKWYIGSPLGSGRQWISWIHAEDVIGMYLFAIENERLEGVFNMAAPNPVTNKQITQAIAKQLRKPLWLPNVPAFALNLLLGEMSAIVLASTKVSAKKIEDAGYKFKYSNVTEALKEIYG